MLPWSRSQSLKAGKFRLTRTSLVAGDILTAEYAGGVGSLMNFVHKVCLWAHHQVQLLSIFREFECVLLNCLLTEHRRSAIRSTCLSNTLFFKDDKPCANYRL